MGEGEVEGGGVMLFILLAGRPFTRSSYSTDWQVLHLFYLPK